MFAQSKLIELSPAVAPRPVGAAGGVVSVAWAETWALLAEAFELSVAQGVEVTERVRRVGGEEAVRAVAIMRKGSHELVQADELELVEATKRLVRTLEPA